MKLLTIGFKGKSAEEFFTALEKASVQKVIDVRRNNTSQLAGFTKGRDLEYFLRRMNIAYEHIAEFGPSDELLGEYRSRLKHKKKDDAAWEAYVSGYMEELRILPVAQVFRNASDGLSQVCLLCSEETAERCHRRLLAEYLLGIIPEIQIKHL